MSQTGNAAVDEPTDDDQPPTLRERQNQRVRDELRNAFIDLVLERGVQGFSLHDVAAAAGISDRTLYRYYPNRESLVEDVLRNGSLVIDTAQHERGVRDPGRDAFESPDVVAGAFEVFEDHAALVRVSTLLRQAGLADRGSADRNQTVRSYLEELDVAPEAMDALVAMVRMLTGSDGWMRMTSPEFGLGSREAGLAAHWAVQVLLQAAGGQEGPLRPELDSEGGGRDG